MTPVSHRWLQYQRMVVGHSKSHEAQMDDERSIIPTIETIRTCLSHLSFVRHLVCCPVRSSPAIRLSIRHQVGVQLHER